MVRVPAMVAGGTPRKLKAGYPALTGRGPLDLLSPANFQYKS